MNGGGKNPHSFLRRFVRLAGGAQARIVIIPTARIVRGVTSEQLIRYSQSREFECVAQRTVLHTTSRSVADSEEFVAPLRDATGLLFTGGRHWRLTDVYLGTSTSREMFNLLDRGGVIAGNSAGASVQASFMVRGAPESNTIMIAPGRERGFGFVTNVAIDQHVNSRGRENDMAGVMQAHPELLGLGLDEGTSITIHRNELIVSRPGRVAIWDGEVHEGRHYYYLYGGGKLDLITRVPTTSKWDSFANMLVGAWQRLIENRFASS